MKSIENPKKSIKIIGWAHANPYVPFIFINFHKFCINFIEFLLIFNYF